MVVTYLGGEGRLAGVGRISSGREWYGEMITKIRWVPRDTMREVKCTLCGEMLSEDRIPLVFEEDDGHKCVEVYCQTCLDNSVIMQSFEREGITDNETMLSELRKLSGEEEDVS